MAQIGEVKLGAGGHGGNARAVEKMGMALCVGQHRCGFPVGLAEMPVGGSRNQPAGRVAVGHQAKQIARPVRGQGEIFPQCRRTAALRVLMGNTEHDQPGQQGFGLLIPVGLADLSRRIGDQRLGQ